MMYVECYLIKQCQLDGQKLVFLENLSCFREIKLLFLFSGVISNSESSRMHFSASVSILLIADLEEGSLFCDRYRYRSLKYELCKYPACISLISTGK